jgi:methionyl-tRNA formyltransferase
MRLKIQRSKINVALFATSDFATLTLQTLLQDKAFNLKALYTQKPQKSGRGMQLNKTPVHKACEDFIIQNPKNKKSKNIKIRFPDKLTRLEEDFLKSLDLDFIVVVSYGLILPEYILNCARYKAVNIHPSSLPLYRGAAPIERSIENCETSSRLCIIKMSKKLDAGDIIYKSDKICIKNKNSLEVSSIFAQVGAKALVMLLKLIYKQNTFLFFKKSLFEDYNLLNKSQIYQKLRDINPFYYLLLKIKNFYNPFFNQTSFQEHTTIDGGEICLEKQNESYATYATKIVKNETYITNKELQNLSVDQVFSKVLAFATYGFLKVDISNKQCKILTATKISFIDVFSDISINFYDDFIKNNINLIEPAKQILICKTLKIQQKNLIKTLEYSLKCRDGFVIPIKIIPQNGKEMEFQSFLNSIK